MDRDYGRRAESARTRSLMESVPTRTPMFRPPNGLGVSCTAGPAWLRQSGAAVSANELPGSEWRTATAVTPSRWR